MSAFDFTFSNISVEKRVKLAPWQLVMLEKKKAERRVSRDIASHLRDNNFDLQYLANIQQEVCEMPHTAPWAPELDEESERLLLDEDAWEAYVQTYLFSTPVVKLPPEEEEVVDINTVMEHLSVEGLERPTASTTCTRGFYPSLKNAKRPDRGVRPLGLQKGAQIPNTVLIRILWATRTLVDVEIYRQGENKCSMCQMVYETIEFSDTEDMDVTAIGLEETAMKRRTKKKTVLLDNWHIEDWPGVSPSGFDKYDFYDSEDERIDNARRRGKLVGEEGTEPPVKGKSEGDSAFCEGEGSQALSEGRSQRSGGSKNSKWTTSSRKSRRSSGRWSRSSRFSRKRSRRRSGRQKSPFTVDERAAKVSARQGGGRAEALAAFGTSDSDGTGKKKQYSSTSELSASYRGIETSQFDGTESSVVHSDTTSGIDSSTNLLEGSKTGNESDEATVHGTAHSRMKDAKSKLVAIKGEQASTTRTTGWQTASSRNADSTDETDSPGSSERRSLQMGTVIQLKDMVCDHSKKTRMSVYHRLVAETNALRRYGMLVEKMRARKAKDISKYQLQEVDREISSGAETEQSASDGEEADSAGYHGSIGKSEDVLPTPEGSMKHRQSVVAESLRGQKVIRSVNLDEESHSEIGLSTEDPDRHLDPNKSQEFFGIRPSKIPADLVAARAKDSKLSKQAKAYLIELLSQTWIYEVVPEAEEQLLGPWKMCDRIIRRFPEQNSPIKILIAREVATIFSRFSHSKADHLLHSLITFLHDEKTNPDVFDAILKALEAIRQQWDAVVGNVLSMVSVVSKELRKLLKDFLVRGGLVDRGDLVFVEAMKWGPVRRRNSKLSLNVQRSLLREAFGFLDKWKDLYLTHSRMVAEELHKEKVEATVRLNMLKILHNYEPECVVETPDGFEVNLKYPSKPDLIQDVDVIESLNYFVEMTENAIADPVDGAMFDPRAPRLADPLDWRRNNLDILVPPCQNRSLQGNLPLMSGVPLPTTLVTHDPDCTGLAPVGWPGISVSITLRISDKYYRRVPPVVGF